MPIVKSEFCLQSTPDRPVFVYSDGNVGDGFDYDLFKTTLWKRLFCMWSVYFGRHDLWYSEYYNHDSLYEINYA